MHADDGTARCGRYCFVHASDLRLDAPVRDAAVPPPPLRAALRDAALRAWRSLVELAVARQAAFVVLTGALFDTDAPTLRACVALRDGLQRLRAHAIEAFIALADTDGPSAPLQPWLGGATLFASDRIDTARVARGDRCLASLHGASAGRFDALRLAGSLRPLGEELQLAVLPTGLADAGRSGRDATPIAGRIDAAALATTGVHYWALGGSAASAVVHRDPWVVHAGTLQGRSLAPSESGPKGCMLVEVEAGRIGDVVLVALDHVRFESLQLDVSDCGDASAIRQRLERELERRVRGDRIAVAEATLGGRLCIAGAPDRRAFEAQLTRALRGACAARSAPVWWARVRDLASRPARAGAAPPTSLHRIVSERSAALAAPLAGSTFLARTFAPLLRQWDAETDLAAQRELVRDAAALALDALAGAGAR